MQKMSKFCLKMHQFLSILPSTNNVSTFLVVHVASNSDECAFSWSSFCSFHFKFVSLFFKFRLRVYKMFKYHFTPKFKISKFTSKFFIFKIHLFFPFFYSLSQLNKLIFSISWHCWKTEIRH